MNLFKIKSLQKQVFLNNLEKSYTEGVYSDTPQNRKLGRVGMSYKKAEEIKDEKDPLQRNYKEAVEEDGRGAAYGRKVAGGGTDGIDLGSNGGGNDGGDNNGGNDGGNNNEDNENNRKYFEKTLNQIESLNISINDNKGHIKILENKIKVLESKPDLFSQDEIKNLEEMIFLYEERINRIEGNKKELKKSLKEKLNSNILNKYLKEKDIENFENL